MLLCFADGSAHGASPGAGIGIIVRISYLTANVAIPVANVIVFMTDNRSNEAAKITVNIKTR
jgi:ABC-type Mn2+/Zn2+ transport system permease subunit